MSRFVYIHFPYCLYKCHYCDFNSYARASGDIPADRVLEDFQTEMKQRHQLYQQTGQHLGAPGEPLEALFLGGGTPSLMTAKQIEILIQTLARYYPLTPKTEITLEANPKTIDLSKLNDFKKAGVTRLSLGVQSLHEKYLGEFGRIHSAEDAREAIAAIQQVGFQSFNVDLIFGFPGQSLVEWQDTLSEIVSFKPPHLSCYAFTVEEGAPYFKMLQAGRVIAPSDDDQADMFKWTKDFLTLHGYDPYETSNYCLPRHESRHNLNYWNYGEFLGLGPGATSFFYHSTSDANTDFGYRTRNHKTPESYHQALKAGSSWFETEQISSQTAMGEFMMMGLRLQNGVDESKFKSLFSKPLNENFKQQLKQNRTQHLLHPDQIALTPQGQLLANQVMASFLS